MTNEMMNVENQVQIWGHYKQIASEMIKSGLLPPTLNTPEKVITVIMTGRELNVPMMESVRGINVISGKPALSPQLMLAMINRSGQLEDLDIDSQPTYCKVTMQRKGRTPHTAKFGEEEAKAMGLLYRDNYKKQAPNMYRWRAISACARVVFPDVIGGLYTPEEIQSHADVEETMATIEHQAAISESPSAYEDFKNSLFTKMEHDLKDAKEPYDVVKWKNGHKGELQSLLDADRDKISQELEKRHSALVRGTGEPSGEPSLTKLGEYCSAADQFGDYASLKEWFLSIEDKAKKDLDNGTYASFIDHLKKCKENFKKDKDKSPSKELDITNMMMDVVDYLKDSLDKTHFEARLLECKPDMASLMGDKKRWMDYEIEKLRDKWKGTQVPKKK